MIELQPENTIGGKLVSSQQPSQMPAAATKRWNRRFVAGLVLTVVALVLGSLAAVMPWWHIDSSVKGQGILPSTFNWDFSMGAWCYRVYGSYRCTAYGGSSSSSVVWSEVNSSFGIAFVLLVGGIALTVVTLVMMVIGSRRNKGRTATLVLGFLGAAFLLGAALYILGVMPGAFNADYRASYSGMTWSVSGFFGSTLLNIDNGLAVGTETFSYYGALGWWLALLSAITLLLGTVMMFRRKRTVVQVTGHVTSPEKAD